MGRLGGEKGASALEEEFCIDYLVAMLGLVSFEHCWVLVEGDRMDDALHSILWTTLEVCSIEEAPTSNL